MSKKRSARKPVRKAKKQSRVRSASSDKKANRRAGTGRAGGKTARSKRSTHAKKSAVRSAGAAPSGRSTATATKPLGGGLKPVRAKPGGRAPAAGGVALATDSTLAASESPQARKARAGRIIAGLHRLYPDADCALDHVSAFELLVATILSAQSTDDTVNKVTPILFERYPTPAAMAEAQPADVEKIVHSTGFFRQKTKSIIGMAKKVVESFDGRIPDRMEDLVTLPGVARKTANVVLGTHFRKNEGVVVDTHVGRLAHRLALTWTSKNDKDAVKIENDLMEVLPRPEWTFVGHALIWHGRRVCSARKPDCKACTLSPHCPSAGRFE
ncbi:MAG: endonuclease III [Phycisphaerales bacterium]|nr:MAG: endonuclease III [Phycisphaerales bacterium]